MKPWPFHHKPRTKPRDLGTVIPFPTEEQREARRAQQGRDQLKKGGDQHAKLFQPW